MCGGIVPPRTRAIRVVVRRRPKPYPYRSQANIIYRPDPRGKMKAHAIDDPGGVGWEIAREVLACPKCAAEGVPRESRSPQAEASDGFDNAVR